MAVVGRFQDKIMDLRVDHPETIRAQVGGQLTCFYSEVCFCKFCHTRLDIASPEYNNIHLLSLTV